MILKHFILILMVILSFSACATNLTQSNNTIQTLRVSENEAQKMPEHIDLVISEYEQHKVFNICNTKVLSVFEYGVFVQCKEDNSIIYYKNLEIINPIIQPNHSISKDLVIGRAQFKHIK